MKKLLGVIGLSLAACSYASAAPGDTTWVMANMDTLSWNGNYDSTVSFPAPGGSWRNIYMVFTLGKYVCPGSPTYCGDWDYTVQNFLMTPGGDTLELGRFITPYANSGAPRTPNTWTQRYVYDVTDYATVLNGTATMRIHYSGYSGGFTGNIKFAFVEGMPDRNVLGVERLYKGSYSYGGATSINTHFPTKNFTAPAGTKTAVVKFNVTGHGSDNNGCCEFMSHDYSVMLNGADVATQPIWRDDCGLNNLYPQSGTWLYERANWCPGAIVHSNFHALPGVTGGDNFDVAINFSPYTSPGGGLGSYTTEAHLIYYGDANRLKDAAITDIVAPTDNENHFRANPVCGNPVITVKNTGKNEITIIEFMYGVDDSGSQSFTWSGHLAPQATTDITLGSLADLLEMAGSTTTHRFTARIRTVNGTADADSTNNIMSSTFASIPLWDQQFRIYFKTNNETSGGVSETEWKIYNDAGTVVQERTNNDINKQYIDTVSLDPGCYRLEITDAGCDGLHWWVWDSNPSAGVNAGFMFVKKYSANVNVPMDGYVYSGTYAHDFGCKFTQYFSTGIPTAVTNVSGFTPVLSVFPNPAGNTVHVDLSGVRQSGKVLLIDLVGRTVRAAQVNVGASVDMSTADINPGLYTVVFMGSDGNKLTARLVVAH